MDQKELKKYKEILIKMRDAVLNKIKDEKWKESLRATSGEHSLSFHLADQGSDCNEHEKSFYLVSLEGDILEQLDDALRRIEEGSFGKCVLCGKEINKKRLEAIPYAKLCLECKTLEERGKI